MVKPAIQKTSLGWSNGQSFLVSKHRPLPDQPFSPLADGCTGPFTVFNPVSRRESRFPLAFSVRHGQALSFLTSHLLPYIRAGGPGEIGALRTTVEMVDAGEVEGEGDASTSPEEAE